MFQVVRGERFHGALETRWGTESDDFVFGKAHWNDARRLASERVQPGWRRVLAGALMTASDWFAKAADALPRREVTEEAFADALYEVCDRPR